MNFDELWRVNLDQERARGDSPEKADAAGRIALPRENANELLLTADDCVFLSALGIRAWENPRHSEMRARRDGKDHK